MRFKRLKTVSFLVIIVVLSMCVFTALIRKYVIPAPPEGHHTGADSVRTISMKL